MLWRQPPVWSPLSLGAILSGLWDAWFTAGVAARNSLDSLLRERYGACELYLTDSGTSALTLALRVAEAVTRAPVALPAYCCYDIATAADGAGVAFHIVELDASSLSPDIADLRRAFEKGARSVVVAHLYGIPADLEAVQSLASEFGALVIEDAAQGSGCEWKGKPAGAHGALGILSFGRGKGVTGGKGGALIVNVPGLVEAVRAAWNTSSGPRTPRGSVKDVLLLLAQWLFGRPWLYWIPAALPFLGLGETNYHPPNPVGGITTLAAGVLLRTFPLVPVEVAHRRVIAEGIGARWGSHQLPVGWQAGWLRYPIVLQDTADSALSTHNIRLGVMRGYPLALADLEGFGARRMNRGAEFPGARRLADRLVTVPTHGFVRSAADLVF